jgi:geranylgeranyl diphosphate synthase, type II
MKPFDIKTATNQLITEINGLKFERKPNELYDPVAYILTLGGKRMRPLLSLLTCYAFDSEYEKAIKPSLLVELFHNFTLIHDDIMDKAPLRRGMPTVHEKWNENIALLAGDVTLIEAYELFEYIPENIRWEIFKLFNLTAKQVCEGQQMDMNFEKQSKVPLEEYIEMIGLKTAVLLGFSMYLGARIGGASAVDAQKMYSIGKRIGIGFQIKDDYLDVYGDADKFGKQVGGDILANKKTFLLLSALERADAESLSRLKLIIASSVFRGNEKVSEVISLYNKLNIKEITFKAMEQYFKEALSDLQNMNIEEFKKSFLVNYFKLLMERES